MASSSADKNGRLFSFILMYFYLLMNAVLSKTATMNTTSDGMGGAIDNAPGDGNFLTNPGTSPVRGRQTTKRVTMDKRTMAEEKKPEPNCD